MRFKKLIGIVHLWLGLASGLVIVIVSLTGAMYVFSEDIMKITDAGSRVVQAEDNARLLPSELKKIADKEIDAFFGKKDIGYWDWQSLKYYNSNTRSVEVSGHRYKTPDVYHQVFLNPYNGKLLTIRDSYASTFWQVVVDLHTSLMLGDVGVYIVEFATLIFLVMVISGMILWWPKNKSAAKQRFWFRWKNHMKWKRRNYDLHTIMGFYMCWIVIFMIVTGLFWSFKWFKNGVYYALDGKLPQEKEVMVDSIIPLQGGSSIQDSIYYIARKKYPNAYSYTLNYPVKKGAPFHILIQETENWAPNSNLFFNPQSGELLSEKKYADYSTGQKFNELTGDIHYGWIFGWYSKIPVFLACLVAASLPFTGFYIWWGRRKKQLMTKQA